MKISGIIFDLDGVIVSTDYYHYLSWKTIADQLNIEFSETDNEKLRGVSRMDSLDIILERSVAEYTTDEKQQLANQKNSIYQKYLHQLSTEDLSIEVKETLIELKKHHIKLAIGSSSKNTMLILEKLGLETFFDAVVDGNMIDYSKPHPQVFMLAALKLNLNSKQCLVVEDAVAGCISAKSASMKVAAIASAFGTPFADYHLKTIRDLIQLVSDN